jgi:hypothetical protein
MKTKKTLQSFAFTCAISFSKLYSKFKKGSQRASITILSFIIIATAFSQGDQTAIAVPISSYSTAQALLHKPDDYATTSIKYPLIIFLHGAGEAGTNLSLIYNNSSAGGPAYFIAHNLWPPSFLVGGVNYKPIVLSPQNNGWSISTTSLNFIMNFMVANYRVDPNRIYLTGLSAGGEGVVGDASHIDIETGLPVNPTYKAAAIVPMSAACGTPAPGWGKTTVADSIRVWGFGSTASDVHGGNTKTYVDYVNTAKPGFGSFTDYAGGHCCWNTFYNPKWRDPISGLTIWEWLLSNTRQLPSVTLPVNFLSFDAKKEVNGIQLTWRVGTEENVLKYEVEKSNDGKTFNTIGYVSASAQSQYSFIDKQLLDKSFYRIKSIDYDNKYKYSGIVYLNQGKTSVVLKVYPIPAQQETILQYPTARQNSKILITSGDGRVLQEIRPNQGSQQTLISLNNIKAGLYLISYEDGEGNSETIKFIKQ